MKKIAFSIMLSFLVAGVCFAGPTDFNRLRIKPVFVDEDLPPFAIFNTSGDTIFQADNNGNITGLIVRCVEYIPTPAVPDSTSIIANTMVDQISSAGTVCVQPDVPRNLNIAIYTYGNANLSSTGNIGVYGVNAKGNSDYESVAIGTFVADSITTRVTNKAFALITLITTDAAFRTTAGAADTISIGYGYKYGLSNDVYGDTIYKLIVNGADVSTSGYVTGTVDGTYDTYNPATAWAATDAVIYYKARIKGSNQ